MRIDRDVIHDLLIKPDSTLNAANDRQEPVVKSSPPPESTPITSECYSRCQQKVQLV